MSNKKLVTATMVAAAAISFASAPISSAFAASDNGIACYGINSCKGQGSCKGANNACKGQNSCKGKGIVMKPSATGCTDAGGTTS